MFVPYVGHVAWGENYRRGEFMADLVGEMRNADVPLGGELPDHIAPLLRYLARTDEPFEDLVEVLPGAAATMQETLKEASARNPYLHLLAATVAYCADLRPLTIGRGS
jgi:nitrate reductase delta subunit